MQINVSRHGELVKPASIRATYGQQLWCLAWAKHKSARATCIAAMTLGLMVALTGGTIAQTSTADGQLLFTKDLVSAQDAGPDDGRHWNLQGVGELTTEAVITMSVQPGAWVDTRGNVIVELRNGENSAVQFRLSPSGGKAGLIGFHYLPRWDSSTGQVVESSEQCCIFESWDAAQLSADRPITLKLILRRGSSSTPAEFVDSSINDGPLVKVKNYILAWGSLTVRVGVSGVGNSAVFRDLQAHALGSTGGPTWPAARITPVTAPTPVPAANLPQSEYNEAHPVLAYYYGWWEPDKLSWGIHQPVDLPANGASSVGADLSLVTRHIEEAIAAGIDGFVVNEGGTLDRMLHLVHGSSFKVALQLTAGRGLDAVLQRGIYDNPDDPNLLRYQGRPVVFFWQTANLSADQWAHLREQVDPDHAEMWIADGDDFSVLRQSAFDGISPYTSAWSSNPAGTLASWSARAAAAAPGKLFIPPISPGCNDTPARTPATCVTERADGAYYQASWQGALAASPTWAIMISTWNEWLEDTQIEPAVQYGDLYLQLTKQFTASRRTNS